MKCKSESLRLDRLAGDMSLLIAISSADAYTSMSNRANVDLGERAMFVELHL